MKLGHLIVLLFLTSFSRAQFFQYGIQAGYLGKQTVVFNRPVVLDQNLFFNDTVYALGGELYKIKNNFPVTLDLYLNYHFSKHYYVGFSHRYLKQESYKNGMHDGSSPLITVYANSMGVNAGYTIRKGRFNLFAEAGLTAAQYKFKYDWKENGSAAIYNDYLNQKNTFLMGFGKMGFTYMAFSFSTRLDVMVMDLRNKSGIKTIKYTPTLNVGFDFRSNTVGKKKFRSTLEEVQLEDNVEFKESFEFPKVSYGVGWFVSLLHFRPRDTGPYAYLYEGYPVEMSLKNQWLQLNSGPTFLLTYAPFKHKHLIFTTELPLSYGSIKDAEIGSITTNLKLPGGNIVEKTSKLDASFTSLLFSLGAGFQFKISDISYLQASPLFNFTHVEFKTIGEDEISGFFRWKRGFSRAYGFNILYARRHWGISIKSSYEITSPEQNNRLKPIQYYSLSIIKYVPMLF